METENSLKLRSQSDSTTIAVFDAERPILEQKQSEWEIAKKLVAKWMELERIICKAPDIVGRIESVEEVHSMVAMMRRYQSLTPKEIGDSMRKAADEAQREFAANSRTFPKMYLADIEEHVQNAVREKAKLKPTALELPANTAGNPFFGEPSDALAREWPKIYANTVGMREQNVNGAKGWADYRDRFWLGGSPEQQAAALTMLRQMVIEMNDAGKWDLKKNQWEAVMLFQKEYREKFTHPNDIGLIDDLICPLDLIQIEEKRSTLAYRLTYRQKKDVGYPAMSDYPDLENAKKCAVFDAYMKFWEGLNHVD